MHSEVVEALPLRRCGVRNGGPTAKRRTSTTGAVPAAARPQATVALFIPAPAESGLSGQGIYSDPAAKPKRQVTATTDRAARPAAATGGTARFTGKNVQRTTLNRQGQMREASYQDNKNHGARYPAARLKNHGTGASNGMKHL